MVIENPFNKNTETVEKTKVKSKKRLRTPTEKLDESSRAFREKEIKRVEMIEEKGIRPENKATRDKYVARLKASLERTHPNR